MSPSRTLGDIADHLTHVHGCFAEDIVLELRISSGPEWRLTASIIGRRRPGGQAGASRTIITGRGLVADDAIADACRRLDHLWATRGLDEARCGRCGKPVAVADDPVSARWVCRGCDTSCHTAAAAH